MSDARLPQFEGCQVVSRLRSGPITDQYHAIQQPLGRPVLIKALSPSILPSSPFAATLEREARVLGALQHGSVLTLYAYERRDDRMWLVLEWVDGFALDELLQKRPRVPPAAAIAIALGVARGLGHAHERGFVHRDVQPRNVIVSRRGAIKIVNFAVAVDEHLPSMPELFDASGELGGPAYLSPEQILGELPDPRSDLFSLGVLLFELLGGGRPFDGPDDRVTTQRIRHDPPPPLGRLAPELPSGLERLVQRCLQKLPADRFASAAELTRALEALLVELGVSDTGEAVRGWLGELGVAEGVPSAPSFARVRTPEERVEGLGRTLAGIAVASVLVLGGAAVLEFMGDPASDAPSARGAAAAGSAAVGGLRVVADPWANVVVDGRLVETTPFARPIELSPGVHYLRLEHPNAPVERRTVTIRAGETVLVDVKLQIESGGATVPAPVDAVAGDGGSPSP